MSAFSPHFEESKKGIREIVSAFGFDANKVRSFEIRMAVNECVTVNAEVFAEIDQAVELVSILKRYKMVPLEDDKPPEYAA